MDSVEHQIDRWRAAVLRGRAVDGGDADELEGHLREQIEELESAGLSGDEAFLIAVKRLGEVDLITAEFAREHSDRLWKQLVMSHPDESGRQSVLTMLGFAVLTAVLIQVARLLAQVPGSSSPWFLRDLSLFVLPVLAAYFAVVRRMPRRPAVGLVGAVAVLAVAVNVFPFPPGSSTDLLVAIHLPFALWFVVGVAYVGGDLRSAARRMDFIRFTGEWAIYYALIALGGAVLLGLTGLVLTPIAPGAIQEVMTWVVPSGAAGAVVVAAWLVEEKKSVIENLAPVLTAIFTPLFAVMLLVSAIGYLVAGVGRDFDRDLLTVFDVLLLVVLGLVVYGISARDTNRPAGLMDVLRLVAVIAAVVLDVLVLGSMLARVGEFGFTANRVAALGLNVVLLVNLVVTAWLIARLLAGKAPAVRLERWQTGYLPVFAGWVLVVVLVVPLLFGFA
ncbi:permease prefix domain 1-containing protein [Agromyces albus]|nr:permease prefix domain 1-containing protein [Agromyces albus]